MPRFTPTRYADGYAKIKTTAPTPGEAKNKWPGTVFVHDEFAKKNSEHEGKTYIVHQYFNANTDCTKRQEKRDKWLLLFFDAALSELPCACDEHGGLQCQLKRAPVYKVCEWIEVHSDEIPTDVLQMQAAART